MVLCENVKHQYYMFIHVVTLFPLLCSNLAPHEDTPSSSDEPPFPSSGSTSHDVGLHF